MPAAMMQPMTSPLALASNDRLSSSMPKTMPARGVLKAAAIPAAAPASSRVLLIGDRRAAADEPHDGSADLDGRALAADRGAAKQSQHHDDDLAEGHAQRDERIARGWVLDLAGRDHLRNAAALRVREHSPRQ